MTESATDRENSRDDENDDDDLFEPKFKYKRVLNDVARILLSDAASCLAVHSKFIALGRYLVLRIQKIPISCMNEK